MKLREAWFLCGETTDQKLAQKTSNEEAAGNLLLLGRLGACSSFTVLSTLSSGSRPCMQRLR